MNEKLFIDSHLMAKAMQTKTTYNLARPFAHAVFKNLFNDQILFKVNQELEHLHPLEKSKNTSHTGKKTCFNPVDHHLGSTTQKVFHDLQSPAFLNFLEELTGIEGLIPDPYHAGGGIHQIGSGGFLKIHSDFNWHDRLKLDRRINVLVYLNTAWEERWRGRLELHNYDTKSCEASVLPTFNTTVVFNTTDFSLHGHPDPLQCPNSVTRKSIAMYYYTAGRPKHERRRSKHVHTIYHERPGEHFLASNSWLKSMLQKYCPPWVYDLRDRFR